ncbi:MAG: hypothetical protein PHN69_06325 [Candidatus Pacebacteria bacterium]|nr:hypothetical protein [Candidatus Paceibacterota bacterium]
MLLKRFKEDKEIMTNKMEEADKLVDQANEIAETAADNFIEKIKSHVKHASREEVMEFLNTKDDAIEEVDKLAVAAMYAEEHDAGIVAIGIM